MITKDMIIADIIEMKPEALDIMTDAGLHCVGCSGASMETLEEGMLSHGFGEDDLEALLTQLNGIKEQKEQTPIPADFEVEIIEEGNKQYYKLAGMMFSQKAYDALHKMKEEKKGFQIRVDLGGCSGYSYKYDYKNTPEVDEKRYFLSDNLNIFMNDFTFNKLHESVVDFQSGIHGSGLKFINPNEKNSCHCGSSVGF